MLVQFITIGSTIMKSVEDEDVQELVEIDTVSGVDSEIPSLIGSIIILVEP